MASCKTNEYFRVLLFALLLPLISGDCIDLDLGMESEQILDNKITASSETSQARNGRLNKIESWCAAKSDTNRYLQIDLQTLHIICAVSTQGNPKSDDWVETYTLQLSTDGTTWTDFTEFGQVKNFTGNSDRNTEKKNIILEGVRTRWLRFVGIASNDRFCMRTEVFGVKLKPENLAAGKNTLQSSTCCGGASARAVDGNADTEFNRGHCSHTEENPNPSWWRVDLGSNNVPVSEVQIVNRFSNYSNVQQRNQDYKITLGNSETVANNPACVGFYTFIQFIASAVCYRNPLKTGRYLGIMTTKKQFLQLCEVEVYSRDNLAYNKNTDQVSTLNPYNSGLAVDGKSNPRIQDRSCTHTRNAANPWWRVDLGQVEPVTEVYLVNRGDCCGSRLNPFEIRVGTDSSNGGIANPKCGDGGYSISQGKGASFFCRPSLHGRYVTITKGSQEALTLCEVEVYSARRACPIQSLGLVSSYAFPDSSFSASTSGSGHEASKGRLNGDGAWSPSTNDDASDYLQINLQNEFFICAVATQGSPTADHWTKKYKLLLSLNSTDWVTYQENNADKILNANDGRDDIVKHMLVGINRARFIRFQPTDFNNTKALRVEVYGLLKTAGPSQAPANFSMTPLTSTSVHASWQLPPKNSIYGIIIGFKLLYRNKSSIGDPVAVITIGDNSTLTTDVTGLGIYTEYEFQVLASSSVGNGPRSVQIVRTNEEAPSQAPSGFTVTKSTSTSIIASWQLLPEYARNGFIRGYKLFYRKKGSNGPATVLKINDGANTTKNVTGLAKFIEYEFQVLAFTSVGDGPNSSVQFEKTKQDAPSAPGIPRQTPIAPSAAHGPRIIISWSRPQPDNGIIRNYIIFYSHSLERQNVQTKTFGADTLSYTVDVLGGVNYEFFVRAVTIKPGENVSLSVDTREYAPSVGPDNVVTSKLNESSFYLSWAPLTREKSYGKVVQYEVNVELIAKGPRSRRSTASSERFNTSETFLVLYDLLLSSQYHLSVRAYTSAGPGPYSQHAVLQTPNTGDTSTAKGSGDSLNITVVIVPVVLLLLLIPAVIIVLLFYQRRKRSQQESDKAHVQLKGIGSEPPRSTTSTANLIYQDPCEMDAPIKKDNQVYENFEVIAKPKPGEQIYQNTKMDTDIRNGKDTTNAPPFEVKEPVYSEADDGKPKPIPASGFPAYFKSKSSNGAAVLRQEFKDLSGGMLSTWEVAKNNKTKNRYGNIVTYDHSRVVLEKIDGNPNSDYINASYIPTYDEKTMCYIATQGPNKVTTNDFWRMIWQENCNNIVMLTNTVEQGKVKCEQYWPENTSKFGAITVTLQKSETFADYLIRTFILVKDSEKREVLQYHYTTWPDRGVPHHSTALLAFRWKVHVRHQLTGGPLVVHCSAGVGRTGTFIGIDAMLESAKQQKSVFIHKYVQVMRKQRPHMIQKEEQYVFLHQAVMEALVCGNTEVAPHDLLIRMNKLARVDKASKQTGYAQEFKHLQLISESEGSEDESKAAVKSANIKKNRFPNIVPLDSARLFLKSSDPEKDYINASFVDDYIQRNAYILTQAPLDNTIDDFWRMVSQYDIGTVVMLNILKEGNEVYPQYWPSAGVARYGKITSEMLSESTVNDITTRKFSVLDAEPPKKKSTVQHLQFTGWSDPNSCPDPQEIIQLLSAIQKSQQQTGNGVIVFQCSDGVGRSGVVSTIMSTIERIKNEQTVDVFQTVNLIRVKRPGAVANVEQYKFCYKTIQVYLDSFNAYSNFADS